MTSLLVTAVGPATKPGAKPEQQLGFLTSEIFETNRSEELEFWRSRMTPKDQ